MCLIIAKNKGVDLPKAEYIEAGTLTNRDGIGIGYHKEGTNEVIIKKDFLNDIQFYHWLTNNVTKEDSCIIHFRMGTSGLKDEGNRHPFPVTQNKELLRQINLSCDVCIAHNGIISEYGKHETYCDTQKFILDILGDEEIKNNLKNLAIQKLIKNIVDTDKLAFLFNDGNLLLLGNFVEEDGLSFSNYGYKPYKYAYRESGFSYSGSRENLPKWYKDKFTKYDDYNKCENCLKWAFETKEIWYKKVKLVLCKDCRKLLAQKQLENLVERKKIEKETPCQHSKALTVPVPLALGEVRCFDCQKVVQKTDAQQRVFGIYTCKKCAIIKNWDNVDWNYVKCQGCSFYEPKSFVNLYQGVMLCQKCINVLENKTKSEDKIKDVT